MGAPQARLWYARPSTRDCQAIAPCPHQEARSRKIRRRFAGPGLGKLPEWNLSDLYSGIDDPAVKRDLDRADNYSVAFEEDFKGKLAALADGPDAGKNAGHGGEAL